MVSLLALKNITTQVLPHSNPGLIKGINMTTIIIPKILARAAFVSNNVITGKGETVQDNLEYLCNEYQSLKKHLFYDSGVFKAHFLLSVDGKLAKCDFPVVSNSEIEILLATSGGLDEDDSEYIPLTNEEISRYARHITLPGFGRKGQEKLKNSRVLIVGTGGLGSPISLYLAAAGVGNIGLIDFDIVESSNLQRQIVHSIKSVGMSKVTSAKRRLLDLNKHINIITYETKIDIDNARELVQSYDLVVDGTDNFSTRYIVNDACSLANKPLVYGAVYQFDGQASVFNHDGGPCYSCVFPHIPPPELSPNCNSAGVIGVLPGVIGLIQATESLKLILGMGDSLSGRLLKYDAMSMKFSEIEITKDLNCSVCSDKRPETDINETPATSNNLDWGTFLLPESFYIDAKSLKTELEAKTNIPILLDVREPEELEVCQLDNILNIPLNLLPSRLAELETNKSFCLVCYSGMRATKAATIMLENNFQKLLVLKGGMKAWNKDVDPDMPFY